MCGRKRGELCITVSVLVAPVFVAARVPAVDECFDAPAPQPTATAQPAATQHVRHAPRRAIATRVPRAGVRRGSLADVPTNLTVVLEDEPGQLATLGGATGAAGVNIEGMCAFTGEGRGIIHLLIADDAVERAVSALQEAGMGIADQREVLVVDVADRPGSLGELTRILAGAGVNIELLYTTFGGVRIVIATDDLENARAALES